LGFVDLHSHILFGIDDGAPTAAEASAMLDALASFGVTESCVTPHQKASQYLPSEQQIATSLQAVTALRKPHHPQLRLGAENMWDEVFYSRLQDGTIPRYRDSPAFLIELPLRDDLPVGLEQALFKLRLAKGLPVLAHPERYTPLYGNDELARRLANHCAFVLDLPALAGYHGKREAKAARHLVDAGLFHAVATDAHCAEDVNRAAEGFRWLQKHTKPGVAERAFSDAPRSILAGQLPDLLS
jgi:protein-tyrosine phosphatase